MRNRDRQPISKKWHSRYFNKKKINACNAVNKKELSVKAINQLQNDQDNSFKELIEFSKEMDDYIGISKTDEPFDYWGDIHEYDLYIAMVKDGYKFPT